jgi:hypothetical protein
MKQNTRISGKHSKPRHPGSMMMRVAGALLCLVMLSTHLMGGLYARYRTEGSGEDEARVIKFGEIAVEETGDFVNVGGVNKFIFTPGVPLKKAVRIYFGGSEAVTYLFAAVHTPGWVMAADQSNFSFSVKGEGGQPDTEILSFQINLGQDPYTKKKWTYLTSEGDTHVYYLALNPNEALGKTGADSAQGLILNDQVQVRPTIPPKGYGDPALKNIHIGITAYAAQANGFETPIAAWQSVSQK